jgi:uncharacterized membrane protein YfcA
MHADLAMALIFFLSALVTSFAGFGFAMISVPLLAILLPVKLAVALQFPYSMGLFVYQAWRYRDHFKWDYAKPFFGGTLIGLTIGAFLLNYLPEVLLKRVLAIIVALVVVANFSGASRRMSERFSKTPWLGRICGLISGSFLGAYNVGAPPMVVYIRSVSHEPLVIKSFIATVFSIQFVILTGVYGATGMFTWSGLLTSAAFLPAVIVGALLGFRLFRYASNNSYRMAVDAILLLAAAILFLRP